MGLDSTGIGRKLNWFTNDRAFRPAKASPNDIAATFAKALGHAVEVREVPRQDWETRFRAEGMQHPEVRIAMLDGFNEGWIEFQKAGTESRKGSTTLESVIQGIVWRGAS